MFGVPIQRDGKSKTCDFKADGNYTCEKFTGDSPLAVAQKILDKKR